MICDLLVRRVSLTDGGTEVVAGTKSELCETSLNRCYYSHDCNKEASRCRSAGK